MTKVSESELLAAFSFDSEASLRAKNALLSGAHFDVWLEPIPATRLLGICRGRVSTLHRRGKVTIGATECLTALAEMGEQGLLVAYVDDRERAGCFYQAYLEPNPLKVVGCMGVNVSPEDGPIAGPA